MKRICPFFLAILLCLFLTVPAHAAAQTGTLTLHCAVGGTAVPDVACRLYKAADLNGTTFTSAAAFENAHVAVNGLTTADQWQSAADSLAVYAGAAENSIQPLSEQTSDENGTAAFDALAPGLYLVLFSGKTENGASFSPALYSMPSWNSDGTVTYQVTAEPKGTSSPAPTDSTEITALKVWNDSGAADSRPASITVALLRDGTEYDTAVLTADNNWRCVWKELPAGSTWTVLERSVPDGYTVAYSSDGSVFTITNTGTGKTVVPTAPTSGKLPQTGQLWWPVPLLVTAGFLFFGIGWHKKNKLEDEA